MSIQSNNQGNNFLFVKLSENDDTARRNVYTVTWTNPEGKEISNHITIRPDVLERKKNDPGFLEKLKKDLALMAACPEIEALQRKVTETPHEENLQLKLRGDTAFKTLGAIKEEKNSLEEKIVNESLKDIDELNPDGLKKVSVLGQHPSVSDDANKTRLETLSKVLETAGKTNQVVLETLAVEPKQIISKSDSSSSSLQNMEKLKTIVLPGLLSINPEKAKEAYKECVAGDETREKTKDPRADLPQNIEKNRYTDIYSKKESNIITDDKFNRDNDYINGSKLVFNEAPNLSFFITQGPISQTEDKQGTVQDYFRHLFGSGAKVAVGTANEMELGRKKTAAFWTGAKSFETTDCKEWKVATEFKEPDSIKGWKVISCKEGPLKNGHAKMGDVYTFRLVDANGKQVKGHDDIKFFHYTN